MKAFTFTVTLQPKCYKSDVQVQYDTTFREVVQPMLWAESLYVIAELTSSFNVHYHGYFTTNSTKSERYIRKYFCDMFRNHPSIGFVNIKPCSSFDGWKQYCCKDLKETKELLGRPPILYDQLNLLDQDNILDGMTQDIDQYSACVIHRGKRVLIQ